MPSVAKTLDQQIAATKAKPAKLEAMKAGKGLEKTSPGVEQLLSSVMQSAWRIDATSLMLFRRYQD